jgi:hypothetical protein
MKIQTRSNIQWVLLSYEEEYSLATSVMDQLCKIHVQGEFRAFLDYMLKYKYETGNNTDYKTIEKLLWFYDMYDITYPDIGSTEDIINPPQQINGHKTTAPWRIQWSQDMTKNIWKEAWKKNPIQDIAEYQLLISSSENDERYKNTQIKIETDFWNEVDKVMNEQELIKADAIKYVSDYMVRGDIN